MEELKLSLWEAMQLQQPVITKYAMHVRKERKKKNYAGSIILPASIKEKETYPPKVP